MAHGLSVRGRFFIAALAIALLSIILTIFIPITYSETVYFDLESIWFIPLKNYMLLGLAFSGIIVALIVLGLKRHIATYLIAAIFMLSAILTGYMSFLSLTTIDREKIYIKDVFVENHYYWTDMTSITLFYADDPTEEYFMFYFDDDSTLKLDSNGPLAMHSSAIYQFANQYNIPFTEKQAE